MENFTFTQRGIVQVDGARIIYRNFSGRGTQFNREGDRNFCLVIPSQKIADRLIEEGFNVKIRQPREEGEEPFMYMKVNVKYHPKTSDLARLNPTAVLITNNRQNRLDDESVCCLDNIDIANVDLDISGSNWSVQGRAGRSAYLSKIYVTQESDRFATRYAEEEYPEEEPFM